MSEVGELTGYEGLRLKLFYPPLCDFDSLQLVAGLIHGVSLLVCMPDKLGSVLRVARVHHVEEVRSVYESSLWQLVREEPAEVR